MPQGFEKGLFPFILENRWPCDDGGHVGAFPYQAFTDGSEILWGTGVSRVGHVQSVPGPHNSPVT